VGCAAGQDKSPEHPEDFIEREIAILTYEVDENDRDAVIREGDQAVSVQAVQELADEGVQIGFTTTAGLPWAEIDDPFDLTFAQQNIFPQLAMSSTV